MDFEMKPYIVYVKIDEQNRIIAVNSSAFLTDINGWTEIDSGFDDKYHHAQGNYFDKCIYNDLGICQYKFVDGMPAERTQEEMDEEYANLPMPEQTNEELLLEMAADHEYRICLMELGIKESEVM